jgi:hypothetical protein
MFYKPRALLTLFEYEQTYPTNNNEKHRHVTIIDKETCLTCPLKSPIHNVRTEKFPWLRVELFL